MQRLGRGAEIIAGMEEGNRRPRVGDYAEEARTYDLTRAASPTVVRLVSRYLGPSDGRSVLDIGGGTGNYAQTLQARGWAVVVVDAEIAMAERSIAKLGAGRQVIGDAVALPFADAASDAAQMIHAIYLLGDRAASCHNRSTSASASTPIIATTSPRSTSAASMTRRRSNRSERTRPCSSRSTSAWSRRAAAGRASQTWRSC